MALDDLDYLHVFAYSSDPVLSAPEVADALEITQQGAHSKLRSLEADSFLRSKKVGARARVFWLSEDGKNYVSESFGASE